MTREFVVWTRIDDTAQAVETDQCYILTRALMGAIGMNRDQMNVRVRQVTSPVLRNIHNHFGKRVRERIAELTVANKALKAEQAAQKELIRSLTEVHSQQLQSKELASLGQLAAGVAHEINNPIAFVNANLGTLQRHVEDLIRALAACEMREDDNSPKTHVAKDSPRQRIDIEYIRADVADLLSESKDGLRRVSRIVQDLKEFSHMGSSEQQWADLEHELDSTLAMVWNELKHKVEVVKEYAGIPMSKCIPAQLNQVFMNLLLNAAQAIEKYGRITLRTGQLRGNVWVEVEDTGKGIQPEHLERIFDPFFTTKQIGSGIGLGLSVSYSIVQRHGGQIEVKSEPGKGSVFRVVLPQIAPIAR